MNDDVSIPTSDPEEMEELQAASSQYLESAISTAKRNLAVLWADPFSERRDLLSGFHAKNDRGLNEPPRKRYKLSYPDANDAKEPTASNSFTAIPQVISSYFSQQVPSQGTAVEQDFGHGTDSHPFYVGSQAPLHSSSNDGFGHSTLTLPENDMNAAPASQGFGSPHASPEDRASADPLLLFTPSPDLQVVSGTGSLSRPGSLSREHLSATTSPSPVHRSPPSPLTPVRSPRPRSPSSRVSDNRPSSDSSHRSHNSSSPGETSQAGPSRLLNPDITDLAEHLQDSEPRRYALRTRNLKQQRPYRFDEALYTRQLRAVPEAIVKWRNIQTGHRRHSSHPREHASGSDSEVDPNAFDAQSSDGERRRRTRSHSAPLREKRRSPQRRSSPNAEGPPGAWVPEVLRQDFSSDSDHEQVADVQGRQEVSSTHHTGASKQKKRLKRFPMSLKKYGKQPVIPNNDDADDDDDIPILSVRRVSSVQNRMVPEDEMKVVNDSIRRGISPDPDVWAVSETSGWPDPDEHLASAPPTSSSIGRLSDVDDHHPQASPSPVPHQAPEIHAPGSRSASQSPHDIPESPLPDNRDGVSESSEQESAMSSDELDAKGRRQYKALLHMMPRSMLPKVLGKPDRSSHRKHKAMTQAPTVGLVRTKTRGTLGLPVEIKGDSESSDTDGDPGQHPPYYQQRTLDVHVGRVRHLSPELLSSSSEASESEASIREEVEDDEVLQWNQHPEEWRKSTGGRLKERSLIDYMLQGTRTSRHTSSKRRQRPGQRNVPSRGPRLATAGISVTIGRSKAHASYRQTRLPEHHSGSNERHSFPNHHGGPSRVQSTSSRAGSSSKQDPTAFHAIPDAAVVQKEKERKRKTVAPGTHTFDGSGRLTSGRRQANYISVDAEDELFEEPNHNFIPNYRKVTHSHKRTASPSVPPVAQRTTLGDYFVHHSPPPPEPEAMPDRIPEHARRIHRRLQVDAGVRPLPLSLSFSLDTYLGKGRLKELLNTRLPILPLQPPPSFYMDGFVLSHMMSISDFAQIIPEKVGGIIAYTSPSSESMTEDQYLMRSRFLYSLCLHFTWFASQASPEERFHLIRSAGQVLAETQKLGLSDSNFRCDGSVYHKLALDIGWTAVEVAFRMQLENSSKEDAERFADHIGVVMEHLWQCNLSNCFDTVTETSASLSYSSIETRLIELWICLDHLLQAWDASNIALSFWDCLGRVMHKSNSAPTGDDEYSTSEIIWKTIFIVCALSQFSAFGSVSSPSPSATSWVPVVSALNLVPHNADPPSQARDKYIALLICRCVHLHTAWRWDLQDSIPVFQYLCRIFQSRRYRNLLQEKHSEFPDFLLHSEIRLLYEYTTGDTAFSTFLKLIAQSADPTMQRVEASCDPPPSTSIKKALAQLIPLGSVKFDKGTPATDKELSMLINRFSAVAVGLIMSPKSFKTYLSQARRYVDFKQMDLKTRRVCIRGLMYLTCILRHFQLPLDEALDWLTSMTDTLVEEFRQAVSQSAHGGGTSSPKERIAICIQMLLGTVRRIIAKPSMNGNISVSRYPDPCLLGGAWVSKVFASSTKLVSISAMRQELVLLVLAFFDARSALIPDPPRPRIPQEGADEESQELYAEMDLFNYDDPELALALGGHTRGVTDTKELESSLCTILKKDVWPAVNSCVYANLKELKSAGKEVLDAYWEHATASIDCWVQCASAIVKNDTKERPWSWFFSIGIPTKDLKQPVRNRVEVWYKLAILRRDPVSFSDYADMFVEHLLQALSVYQITVEHDYVSLVMVSGGYKHPLLQGVLQACPMNSEDIRLTKADLLNIREDVIGRIISNLHASFGRESATDYALRDQNRLYLNYLADMFFLMRETLEGLAISDKEEYGGFCRAISAKLAQCSTLQDRCRDNSSLSWALTMSSAP